MNRDPQTANRTSTKPTAGSPRHISRASRRITVTFNSRCSNSKGNYGRSPCIRTYVECTQQRGGNSRVTRERCGAKCYPTVVQRQKVPISILPERVNTSETDDTTHTHTHTWCLFLYIPPLIASSGVEDATSASSIETNDRRSDCNRKN